MWKYETSGNFEVDIYKSTSTQKSTEVDLNFYGIFRFIFQFSWSRGPTLCGGYIFVSISIPRDSTSIRVRISGSKSLVTSLLWLIDEGRRISDVMM